MAMLNNQRVIWVWVNTYRYIFSGMNIHLPAILMFTRGTRVLTHPHLSSNIQYTINYKLLSSGALGSPAPFAPASRT